MALHGVVHVQCSAVCLVSFMHVQCVIAIRNYDVLPW